MVPEKILIDVLFPLLADMGMLWIFKWITGQTPSDEKYSKLHDTIVKSVSKISIGPKAEKGDEAVFGALRAMLNEDDFDSIGDLLSYMNKIDTTGETADNFRWTISLMAEKMDEAKAVEALRKLAQKPNAKKMYESAQNDGYIKPDDGAEAAYETFLKRLPELLTKAGEQGRLLLEKLSQQLESLNISVEASLARVDFRNRIQTRTNDAKARLEARRNARNGGTP